MVRRKKTSFFTDLKDTSTILDLKKMIEGVLKFSPEDQQLSDESGAVVYRDDRTLAECSLTGTNAKAHSPAIIGLAVRKPGQSFEKLEIDSLSQPPDLPEIMRPESGPAQE